MQFAIQALVVYFVILWLAAAYWAFRDMQQRSENPVLPYLAAALIVLFTPVLFVFGIIVYRIIRPHEKIGEVYERNLAEEALLAEVEAIKTCPSCRRRVNDEWIICPTLPHAAQPRVRQLRPPRRARLGPVRVVRPDFERSDLAAYQPIAGAGARRASAVDDRRRPPSARAPSTAAGPRPPAAVRESRAHRARSRSLDRAGRAGPRRPIAAAPVDVQPRGPHASRRSTSSAGSAPSWASPSSSCRCSRAERAAAPWLFLAGLILLAIGLLSATGSQAIERQPPDRAPVPRAVAGPRLRRRHRASR